MIKDIVDIQPSDWSYVSKESLGPREFLVQIAKILKVSEIVSFGEQHDLNEDNSFEWLRKFSLPITNAFEYYSDFQRKGKTVLFERCVQPSSNLLEEIQQHPNPGFEAMLNNHPGRIFALGILPLAVKLGFTDIILEGLDDKNPQRSLERDKDKNGTLLRLVTGMQLGFKIHGAYEEGLLSSAVDVGNALYRKIKEIKIQNPDAKILVYNGAMHNMTVPFEGTVRNPLTNVEYNIRDISYAPQLIEEYKDKYASIDLIQGNSPIPDSRFRIMQDNAKHGITKFEHGIRQLSFIFKGI